MLTKKGKRDVPVLTIAKGPGRRKSVNLSRATSSLAGHCKKSLVGTQVEAKQRQDYLLL